MDSPYPSVPQALAIHFDMLSSVQLAILCFGDITEVFGNEMLPLIDGEGACKPADSALCQLLLKSVSKDKKFVLEAAQEVLNACCDSLDAAGMIKMLLPYAKHKCAQAGPDVCRA
jgi:hypothetical protein